MSKEEAMEIAQLYDRVKQVSFFITFLGMPPKEALIKAGINI